MDVIVAIGSNVRLGEPSRCSRPVGVHLTTDPDRFVVLESDDNCLMNVK